MCLERCREMKHWAESELQHEMVPALHLPLLLPAPSVPELTVVVRPECLSLVKHKFALLLNYSAYIKNIHFTVLNLLADMGFALRSNEKNLKNIQEKMTFKYPFISDHSAPREVGMAVPWSSPEYHLPGI
ncbi:uncharacterized protein [Excalfactoria chinensis]|uniref:uncharacterized protein isoform X3 n=1 Tax=Excalfactoria chinensis TaxID=46218 RepID=UPI003B3B21E0